MCGRSATVPLHLCPCMFRGGPYGRRASHHGRPCQRRELPRRARQRHAPPGVRNQVDDQALALVGGCASPHVLQEPVQHRSYPKRAWYARLFGVLLTRASASAEHPHPTPAPKSPSAAWRTQSPKKRLSNAYPAGASAFTRMPCSTRAPAALLAAPLLVKP